MYFFFFFFCKNETKFLSKNWNFLGTFSQQVSSSHGTTQNRFRFSALLRNSLVLPWCETENVMQLFISHLHGYLEVTIHIRFQLNLS
jgi:hypothetical protein